MRVLVVEDAQPLAEAIAAGLRDQAIAADVAFDGATAEEQLAVNDYDVVILDRDLPLVHGDDICRSLASSGAMVRILMLTAAGDLLDRVEGLGLGADDYLAKPFAFAELVARVRALGRRARPPDPPVLERAGIRLDPARQEATEKWPAAAAAAQGTRGPRGTAPRAAAPSCPPSSCWRRRGTRTSTRSPTSSGSRS